MLQEFLAAGSGRRVGALLAAGPAAFGRSSKTADVCKKFGITTDAILRAAREVVRDVHG